ncbi:MAG: hypothetical protein NZ853_02065 [Leptospiraceae bacterium]|nr:hypothetical protein [Leptospiraceae bacterium]
MVYSIIILTFYSSYDLSGVNYRIFPKKDPFTDVCSSFSHVNLNFCIINQESSLSILFPFWNYWLIHHSHKFAYSNALIEKISIHQIFHLDVAGLELYPIFSRAPP